LIILSIIEKYCGLAFGQARMYFIYSLWGLLGGHSPWATIPLGQSFPLGGYSPWAVIPFGSNSHWGVIFFQAGSQNGD